MTMVTVTLRVNSHDVAGSSRRVLDRALRRERNRLFWRVRGIERRIDRSSFPGGHPRSHGTLAVARRELEEAERLLREAGVWSYADD